MLEGSPPGVLGALALACTGAVAPSQGWLPVAFGSLGLMPFWLQGLHLGPPSAPMTRVGARLSLGCGAPALPTEDVLGLTHHTRTTHVHNTHHTHTTHCTQARASCLHY